MGVPLIVPIASCVNIPVYVFAVSYPPAAFYHQHVPGALMQVGEIEYCFIVALSSLRAQFILQISLPYME